MTPAQLDALVDASRPDRKAVDEPQADNLLALKMFERIPLVG